MIKRTQTIYCILIALILSSSNISAQNFPVKGQFTGKQLEKSFINVINTTQYISSISHLDGKFEITAKVGDSILISSIQYLDVKFVVQPEFQTQSIEIALKLKVNELEQVDIYSLGLTGDLEKDAKNIKTEELLELNLSLFDIENAYDPEVNTKSEFTLQNDAFDKTQPNIPTNFDLIMMGMMVKNLLFKRNKKKKKKNITGNLSDENVFTIDDISSLRYYLDIEENTLEHFMIYAYKNGLEEFLKKKPSEIDLIQFLVELAQNFKKTNGVKK